MRTFESLTRISVGAGSAVAAFMCFVSGLWFGGACFATVSIFLLRVR